MPVSCSVVISIVQMFRNVGHIKILVRQIYEKKNSKYQMSSKSVQWELSCSVWTDRRT